MYSIVEIIEIIENSKHLMLIWNSSLMKKKKIKEFGYKNQILELWKKKKNSFLMQFFLFFSTQNEE